MTPDATSILVRRDCAATTVPYGERTWVIEALWRIAATGGIQADEHGLMRLVASLLGVSDQDSGLARQRVLRSEGR